jgi:RND family efflux transporter MFP subunit
MNDLNKLKIDRELTIRRPARRPRLNYLLLLAAIVITAIWFATAGVPEILRPHVKVETGNVVTAWPAQGLTLFNATGYVVPQTRSDIASKATGRLEILYVEEGSRVEKDQIIAQLENRDVKATMERAEAGVTVARAAVAEANARLNEAHAHVAEAHAELRDAEISRKRADNLVGKKYITPEVHDAAIARYDKAVAGVASAEAGVTAAESSIKAAEAQVVSAEAGYREAQVAVDYTYIRAPFAGVILTKQADIGDVVAPFATSAQSKGSVVSMADLSTLQVEADVNESNLTLIRDKQPCEIQLDALPDVRLRGEVHMIVPTVDRTKATVLAKIRFIDKDERILPDMSAQVSFLSRPLVATDQVPLTALPSVAVVTRDQQSFAFRVEGNIVHKVAIVTGERIGDMIVVSEGLQAGDQVVLNPPGKLRDAMQVSVLSQ